MDQEPGQQQSMRGRVMASVPEPWWDRLKGAQYGFIAGILIGLIFGWIFHGVISLAVRFGLLALLLLPILVIGWLWFRSQRTTVIVRTSGGVPEAEWRPVDRGEYVVVPTEREPRAQSPFEDVPIVRKREEARPVDIEAELAALKRDQERSR